MEFMLSRTIKRGLRWYLKAKHFEKCDHLLINERIVDFTHSIENRGTTLIAGLASRVPNLKVRSILGATAIIIPSQLLAIVSFDDDVISATIDNKL